MTISPSLKEIDAIGGKRFSEGTSADREIQRTLMELLNQMDGFDVLGKVKIIMATNRPDVRILSFCFFPFSLEVGSRSCVASSWSS